MENKFKLIPNTHYIANHCRFNENGNEVYVGNLQDYYAVRNVELYIDECGILHILGIKCYWVEHREHYERYMEINASYLNQFESGCTTQYTPKWYQRKLKDLLKSNITYTRLNEGWNKLKNEHPVEYAISDYFLKFEPDELTEIKSTKLQKTNTKILLKD